jgi:hypothetical protein
MGRTGHQGQRGPQGGEEGQGRRGGRGPGVTGHRWSTLLPRVAGVIHPAFPSPQQSSGARGGCRTHRRLSFISLGFRLAWLGMGEGERTRGEARGRSSCGVNATPRRGRVSSCKTRRSRPGRGATPPAVEVCKSHAHGCLPPIPCAACRPATPFEGTDLPVRFCFASGGEATAEWIPGERCFCSRPASPPPPFFQLFSLCSGGFSRDFRLKVIS